MKNYAAEYRMYIIAYPRRNKANEEGLMVNPMCVGNRFPQGPLCTGWNGAQYAGEWACEPSVVRVADGIPGRVDSLRSLGNAVVPQIPQQLFQMIANEGSSQ